MPLSLQKMKRAFQRTTSHLALLCGLGLGLTGFQAEAQHNIPVYPGFETRITIYPIPQYPVMPTKIDEASALYGEFSKTELGCELLAFAKANNIGMAYDAKVNAADNCAEYNADTNIISLSYGMTADDQLISLAHELWHAWQDIHIKYSEGRDILLAPQEQWTLNRFIEVDAFAFSSYFLADYLHSTGKETVDAPFSEDEAAVAEKLLSEIRSCDGLTLAEYRTVAFEYFTANLPGYYKGCHLRHNENAAVKMFGKLDQVDKYIQDEKLNVAHRELNDIRETASNKPDCFPLEERLRQFGANEINPKATCLQANAVSSETLLQDYPFRCPANEDAAAYKAGLCKAFNETAERYEAVRKRIERTQDALDYEVATKVRLIVTH